MTAIVLQARLDSTRLPGKAMLLLDGKPLIFRVMESLNKIDADLRVLACTEDSLNSFYSLSKDAGFKIHAGPKDNVLERFGQVIRKYSIDRLIRATGDNPFVFADAANMINCEAVSLDADYAGFTDLPYGSGVESVSAPALLKAAAYATLLPEREHVCPYLYNHPEMFKIHRPLAPLEWRYPDMRLTVDTQEDYDRAVKLYEELKNEPQKNDGSVIIKAYQSLFGGR